MQCTRHAQPWLGMRSLCPSFYAVLRLLGTYLGLMMALGQASA